MTQKQFIVVAGTTTLLVLAGALMYKAPRNDSEAPVSPDNANVVLTEKGFAPDKVFVKLHGTVTFSTDRDKPFWPASNLHPSHGIYQEFDPREPLSSQKQWTFQFDRAGEWGYHDHLRSYFIGTIYVVE